MEHWVASGEGHTMAYSNHKEEYVQRVLAFYDKHMK
jgi:dipeptidyl aminopeptidase/acylaminoacyl peptidase